MKDLAVTLETLSERGADDFYRGKLAGAVVDHLREHGGAITSRDLAEYRTIRRRPVQTGYFGHEFLSNPPPSSGGVLIGYGLRLLEALGADAQAGSAEAIAVVVEVMREQARARDNRFGRDLYRGGLAKRLYTKSAMREAMGRMRIAAPVPEVAPPSGTTHISVVDERGNAAALTVSTGSGSGVIIPGTGIQLNNMLGEFDLDPASGDPQPGVRLTSMMAPSLVLKDGRPRLVVGSAGSLRLRGAILQVVVNVVRHGMPVEEAISAPRVHVDDGHVHCEGGSDPAELDRLEALGYDLVRWRQAEPLLRRRLGGGDAPRRKPRGHRRSAARRTWHRRPGMSDWLIVRPAVPADSEALVNLGRSVAAEGELWLTYNRSQSDERRNVKRVRRDPNAAVFVAETPAGVVGRLSIARDGNPISHHVAELGLMVATGQRRQGVGTALMEEAAAWARRSGVTKLELHVFPHNEPAIALYRKLGYQDEGHRHRHYRIGGHYMDAILMAFYLD